MCDFSPDSYREVWKWGFMRKWTTTSGRKPAQLAREKLIERLDRAF